MKKAFCSFLFLLIFSTSNAICQDSLKVNQWEGEVVAYEKSDSINPPPLNGVVFTGSSSIRMWKDIADRFPGKKVINRGIGGAQMDDIVYYADRLIFKYKPRKVFIYCGSNDIASGKTPEEVLETFKKLYLGIKSKLPNTKVYFISIQSAPVRESNTDAFKRANELIKAYISSKTQDVYVDIFPLLLDTNGKPRPEFFLEDQLHMNAKGYDRWARVLKAYVEQ